MQKAQLIVFLRLIKFNLNKKHFFDTKELTLSEFARVMGHPARIAIIKELAKRETCICGEIVEVIPLAQSTISQHLKELKKAGLIQGTVNGVKSCYCINWENFNRLSQEMDQFFKETRDLGTQKQCCKK